MFIFIYSSVRFLRYKIDFNTILACTRYNNTSVSADFLSRALAPDFVCHNTVKVLVKLKQQKYRLNVKEQRNIVLRSASLVVIGLMRWAAESARLCGVRGVCGVRVRRVRRVSGVRERAVRRVAAVRTVFRRQRAPACP
ncbi:unnamed protein product [Parnassius apollo]|uniref:(apollo) hypothetical protein n=1 Tax=Parnassius apollo TaxID=110799 RepID=A0A8S3WUJ2_PARAO|nr:unnamed protein product [Parnassius apollo]